MEAARSGVLRDLAATGLYFGAKAVVGDESDGMKSA
jgi:hypothetical protein